MKDPRNNDNDNFVVFSYDGQSDHISIRVEKRDGSTRNWEDEDEWQCLGLSADKYKRYHLTAEQAEKFFQRKD